MYYYDESDELAPIDIDTPVTDLMVAKHEARPRTQTLSPNSRLPKDLWDDIPVDDRRKWSSITNASKSKVISHLSKVPPQGSTQVQLHSMSALDYIHDKWRVNLSDMSAHDLIRSMEDDTVATADSSTGTSSISSNND